MLETTYYILAIITMSIFLAMLMGLIFLAVKVKREMENFKKNAVAKSFSLLKKRNIEVLSAIGLTVGQFVLGKILGGIKKRK